MNLSGSPLDYLIAFLGGLLVSFTPCVYPLVPVTIGYIGANSRGSKLRGFSLSLVYVTGIAVTYSALGLAASLTGSFFGRISSLPVSYFIVGGIIVLFGLSMLELFSIHLTKAVKPHNLKKGNYFSTFFLGVTSGLIASPCLTPVLGSILAYLTTKKNIAYGVTLLFSFAYGMGFILILAGTFSAFLLNLPKSGRWLSFVKKAFAFIMIGIGIYFIYQGVRRL